MFAWIPWLFAAQVAAQPPAPAPQPAPDQKALEQQFQQTLQQDTAEAAKNQPAPAAAAATPPPPPGSGGNILNPEISVIGSFAAVARRDGDVPCRRRSTGAGRGGPGARARLRRRRRSLLQDAYLPHDAGRRPHRDRGGLPADDRAAERVSLQGRHLPLELRPEQRAAPARAGLPAAAA